MNTMKVYERLINRKKEISQGDKEIQEEPVNSASFKNASMDSCSTRDNLFNARASEEIELIENAINKLENGDYGVCEHCGQDIKEERLESLPWASLCFECEEKQRRNLVFEKSRLREIANSSGVEKNTADISEDEFENLMEMSDEELKEFLYEQLQEENRIETWDLDITVQDKIVYLEGNMPNDVQYYSLLAIIKEYIYPEDIVDNILMQDSTGWEDESDFEDHFDKSDDDMLRERDEFLVPSDKISRRRDFPDEFDKGF